MITADSLKSGNYKDVLTSFFQLAFSNLTSSNKSLDFNSNPFAIMARANEKFYEGSNWYTYRHLRDLNFNVGLGVDSNYHISNFSFGVKYAVINKRDLTTSKAFYHAVSKSEGTINRSALNQFLNEIVARLSSDRAKQRKYKNEANNLSAQSDKKWAFKNLSPGFLEEIQKHYNGLSDKDKEKYAYVKNLLEHPNVRPGDEAIENYNALRNEWLQKPLLVAGVSASSHTNQSTFSKVNFSSEFLCGVLKNNARTFTGEFDIKALYAISNDSLVIGHNLNRKIFSIEPGVNFALRTKNENKSYLEFKLSGSYYHNFSGSYNNAKADSSTLNAEIRIRVYDDIWIPVVLKYNPEHKNLLGFLNISTNFTGLGNTLKRRP